MFSLRRTKSRGSEIGQRVVVRDWAGRRGAAAHARMRAALGHVGGSAADARGVWRGGGGLDARDYKRGSWQIDFGRLDLRL